MRLALVSQEYPPETAKGGIGTQTYLKAHGLAARGHEVFVISRSPDKEARDYQDGPVHVQRIPGFGHRLPLYTEIADWVAYSTAVAGAIADRHAATPLDLVDFPEWAAEGFVHLLNQTEWNRIATVVQLHGPLVFFGHAMGWPALDSEFYRTGTQMEAACLRLADARFTSSRYSADWAAQYYDLPADEIPVIHTGVDVDLFRPGAREKAQQPMIVFAGKLVENKGVFALVQAAIEVSRTHPNLRLRLIGRGAPEIIARLEKIEQAAGKTGLLELSGFVRREELPALLAEGHVFAAPAPCEGGPGLAYLEAMACGLPAIACAGSGAAEVVHDGVNGVLVPPNNHDALVAALLRILDTDGATLGRNAREYAVTNTSSERCLDRLEAFYEQVVNRVKVSPP